MALGARGVVACDTDPVAVEVARERLSALPVHLYVGSIDAIEPHRFDLITANISPEWLAQLAPEWRRVLKPAGKAILSGIEAQDVEFVRHALESAGMRIVTEQAENSWRAIVVTETPAPQA